MYSVYVDVGMFQNLGILVMSCALLVFCMHPMPDSFYLHRCTRTHTTLTHNAHIHTYMHTCSHMLGLKQINTNFNAQIV